MTIPEKVHAHIYDPSGPTLFKPEANARAKSFSVTCEMTSQCDAFKEGTCIRLRTGFGGGDRCKYGGIQVRTGMTRRARSYYTWISDERKRLAEFPKAKRAPSRVFKIGEFWNLPYAHMAESWAGGNYPIKSEWVHQDDMTPEMMASIVNGKPTAMMGGVITSYQQESVPRFLEDVRRNYPELWKIVPEDAKARVQSTDYTGRKAVLETCAPGKFGNWVWDGKTLSGGAVNSLMLPAEAEHIVLTPKSGATIKITENSQVTDATVFVD